MPDTSTLAGRLHVLDQAIASRHQRFLDALTAGHLDVADFWHQQRDLGLEDRHAMLTTARLADVIKETA